jgi:hypothetical protein
MIISYCNSDYLFWRRSQRGVIYLMRGFCNFIIPSTNALLFFAMTINLGCGSAAKPGEKLVEASGTVTLDGKPVDGIRMAFQPQGGTKAVGGYWGVTDKDGKFTVSDASNKKGLPPGKYEVLFSRRVKPDGSLLGPNESPTVVQSSESIAKMFNDPGKAGAHNRVEIPDAGNRDLTFKVTSQPAKKK